MYDVTNSNRMKNLNSNYFNENYTRIFAEFITIKINLKYNINIYTFHSYINIMVYEITKWLNILVFTDLSLIFFLVSMMGSLY